MRIFISAGEPSGDLHGANLARALLRLRPEAKCVGFGGERMESAGCELLYPLTRLAVMWFLRALAHAPTFLSLLSRADRWFHHHRPDAVVLIDYPGFHWWLARRAHFHRLPVFWFVPPQLWGWAGWRVKKMRRWVDHVLCTLPFEVDWYRKRGVEAHFVGHPYFDELRAQQLDADFVSVWRGPSVPVALLPGSRDQEVQRNLPTLVRAAELIHRERPDTRFLVACFKDSHRQSVDAALRGRALPATTFVGRTPEIIAAARACVAVSGSVGLELLYRGTPSVVVYRVGRFDLKVARRLMTAPHISLVNLLAGKELFPEFLTDHCPAEAVAGHVLGWLNDSGAHAAVTAELAALRERVVIPGACERAAEFVLNMVGRRAAA
jgi:lipid-A-disaccharide synthase